MDKTEQCWMCGAWGSDLKPTVWVRSDGTEHVHPTRVVCKSAIDCEMRTAQNHMRARLLGPMIKP